MQLTEKEFKLFKKWLKGHLAYGPTSVTFLKKDGSERVMNCTTNKEYIPLSLQESSSDSQKIKKKNEDVIPVFDIESQAWRSFRWDSIKSVSFTLS
jgi:hypothetical protein